MNATHLLALSRGTPCAGDDRCFYCGNPAGVIRLDLKSSFNEWWTVAAPGSTAVCSGCAIALDEKVVIAGREKPQKTRNWSWLITAARATPLFDVASVRAACLNPPSDPWALAIAVSGQKHVIYRTPANTAGEPFAVQLETQPVVYRVAELRERLSLAMRVAAVLGKPSLTEPLGVGGFIRLSETYTDAEQIQREWFTRAAEPLNQLAAYLCPPKMECESEQLEIAGRA